MGEWLLANTAWLPDWSRILLLSSFPLTELRAGIPISLVAWPGLPWWEVYALSVAGNMLPVPFVLMLLGPVSRFLSRWSFFRKFFDWIFTRARRNAGRSIERYEALGLAVFVAIPLPMTGAWSGAVAAFLFGIPNRLALPSILAGVLAAGALVMLISSGAMAGLGALSGS